MADDKSTRPKRTVIDHHSDGSHTVRPEPGEASAHPDDKSMADAVKSNLGENNSIEIEPLPATALPKPKYGSPLDSRARQMKPGEDIKTT